MICIPDRMSYDDHKFAKIKRDTKCDELQIKIKHIFINIFIYILENLIFQMFTVIEKI